MVASQSSSVSSSIGRAMSTPALLTRTPISPSACEHVLDHARHLGGIGDVGGAPGGLDTRRAKLRHAATRPCAARAGADADAVAGAAERERGGAADAVRWRR